MSRYMFPTCKTWNPLSVIPMAITEREICLLKISLQWKELCRVIHSLLAPHWDSNNRGAWQRSYASALQPPLSLPPDLCLILSPLFPFTIIPGAPSQKHPPILEQPTALPSADKSQHFTTSGYYMGLYIPVWHTYLLKRAWVCHKLK